MYDSAVALATWGSGTVVLFGAVLAAVTSVLVAVLAVVDAEVCRGVVGEVEVGSVEAVSGSAMAGDSVFAPLVLAPPVRSPPAEHPEIARSTAPATAATALGIRIP